MIVFPGTGPAEPKTLIKALMKSGTNNLNDLELLQLVSLGEAFSLEDLKTNKYRLKTFFAGWQAGEAISEGLVDLIPSRFKKIPQLIRTGYFPIDAVFIQVAPPNKAGYCSLGIAVNVAHEAIKKASLVVGEINPDLPQTYGDTFVHFSELDVTPEAQRRAILKTIDTFLKGAEK
ncbi:MAG: hypothetical protein GY714_00640 [Desulfobacterales bacterium]|nr:hypothetical protein [Desulfobacterales bacterium]